MIGWSSKLCLYEDWAEFMNLFIEPGIQHLAWMDANAHLIKYDDFNQKRISNFECEEYNVWMDMDFRIQGRLIIGYEEIPKPEWFLDDATADYYDSD